jgi:predicted AAA+ superfamily ATPase
VDENLQTLVWRGLLDANPWWKIRAVPPQRTASYRRKAFGSIYSALMSSEHGRGVVMLGPRRVGKTVLVHQIIEQLLADGRAATDICFMALDDVALRDRDLGELLALIEGRLDPAPSGRVLILDEVQHAKEWSGWLKRIADRRDPYTFLATGSSATALRRGGQDAGLGRWRELILFPWSFREHVELRDLDKQWSFAIHERAIHGSEDLLDVLREVGNMPPDEAERLESAFVDYLLRGGFPEAALATDLADSRRRLRQDILDRALGRDVLDVVSVDPRTLERMFLRICMHPGGLWNEAEVARELGITRPTVAKYLSILEHAFLVCRLPNLASPVRGQPKVYLVAPALRQALLALDDEDVRRPQEWGLLAENTVVSTAMSTRQAGEQIGFWRKGSHECDLVLLSTETNGSEFIEVKRGGTKALAGIEAAAQALRPREQNRGLILAREPGYRLVSNEQTVPLHHVGRMPLSVWLYAQQSDALSDSQLD